MDSVCADKSVGKKQRGEAFEHGPANPSPTPIRDSHSRLIALKLLQHLLFHFYPVTFPELNAVSIHQLAEGKNLLSSLKTFGTFSYISYNTIV